MREYGSSVRGRHEVSLLSQAADIVRYRLSYGLDPIAYYRFQLFRPERARAAAGFVQTAEVGPVLKWLVRSTPGYPAVFRDKRVFNQWCETSRLPAVPALAEFEHGAVVRRHHAGLPPVDLFSKPSNWQGGRGAARWRYAGTDRWRGPSDRAFSGAELLDYLARQSADLNRPMLLQQLLVNHAALRPLVSGGLCTARVVTVRSPGKAAELLLAVYRMPVAPTIADNFDLGGIAAPIDISTGELGPGIRKYPRVVDGIDTHPDTGMRITGRMLPYWAEAAQLALTAHDAISWPGVPAVGWDVAILDEGPVLLEGNNVPCSTLAQMPSGTPLGGTAFVACINQHLRATIGPTAEAVANPGVINAA